MVKREMVVSYYSLILHNDFQLPVNPDEEMTSPTDYEWVRSNLNRVFNDYKHFKEIGMTNKGRLHIVFSKPFNNFQEFYSYFNNKEITEEDFLDYRSKISILKKFGPTINIFVHDVDLNSITL